MIETLLTSYKSSQPISFCKKLSDKNLQKVKTYFIFIF